MLAGQMRPPTNPGGYWTNHSAIGTFDHHGAGCGDIPPGQGYASRRGASEFDFCRFPKWRKVAPKPSVTGSGLRLDSEGSQLSREPFDVFSFGL